mmetsp:Transcript_29608/g.64378  ORF Transcript_29608/g.64378 Transcript_29608/m.64378 type:complete len:524 (+) Transcript_29608:63-1634(+)
MPGRAICKWYLGNMIFGTSLVLAVLVGPIRCDSKTVTVFEKVAHLEKLVQANKDTLHRLDGQAQQPRPRRLDEIELATEEMMTDLKTAMSQCWNVLTGALVMFMQAGFALLTAGVCRVKNVQSVLLKNITDVVVGTIGWYTIGFMFAYGDVDKYAGNQNAFGVGFASADPITGNQTPQGYGAHWFFQWAFCGAAATIVSGGVMERVQFPAYCLYSLLMSAFIYPAVVGWTWGGGWLAGGEDGHINSVGYMDFAGSGIVHLVGGVGALVGAIVAGPREGRWDNEDDFIPHSTPLLVLGTFFLWFGWYGFNCGSTLTMEDTATGLLASHVAMTTTIGAASGGLVCFGIQYALIRKYDIGAFCNGILVGLVSITAPCATVETGSAVAIGAIGAVLYTITSNGLKKIKIDDPMDAFAVHGVGGAWGVLAAALFDYGKGFDHVNGWSYWSCMTDETTGNCREGIWGQLLAANLAQILAVTIWTAVTSTIIFVPLKLLGFLRSDVNLQASGADAKKHSPSKGYSIPAIK